MQEFEILKKPGKAKNLKQSKARLGIIRTLNGDIQTPAFMPVGTCGTVKALSSQDLDHCKAQIILGNTYHLYLRPGVEIILHHEGLHKFMAWDKPILTDSGGFQFFSLAKLSKFFDEKVMFQSHIDGSKHFFSPEKAVEIQMNFDSDIMMSLDLCIGYGASEEQTLDALNKTTLWAKKGYEHWEKNKKKNKLFGIIQGGMFKHLRKLSADELTKIDFSGFAIGGLSVGEPKEIMYEIAKSTLPLLPFEKPRYIMGVGTPSDLVEFVNMGADMFDCVIPSRNARNGQIFCGRGKINIANSKFKFDKKPIDEDCNCLTCLNYSRSYLRHLYKSKELLAYRLNTIHNIYYYLDLMEKIRRAIREDRFLEFKLDFYSKIQN